MRREGAGRWAMRRRDGAAPCRAGIRVRGPRMAPSLRTVVILVAGLACSLLPRRASGQNAAILHVSAHVIDDRATRAMDAATQQSLARALEVWRRVGGTASPGVVVLPHSPALVRYRVLGREATIDVEYVGN